MSNARIVKSMHIHRSNRVEALLPTLARIVSVPPSDPFEPEWIVVQGPGMERWLSLELSRRIGVFAHPRFPFSRTFLREMMACVLGPEGDDTARYEPERLMWSVATELPKHLESPDFAPLAHYLANDESGDKAFQLARRIAETFDHYVVHRPEMILAWEKGQSGDVGRLPAEEVVWQRVLWRSLVERIGSGHLAFRMLTFVERLYSAEPLAADLPERVSLFGVSTLPPLFVDGLAALSNHVEMHLFLLSPSREYWGHIRSEREQIRARGKVVEEEDLHFEQGHPLLASLGRVGREFQEIIEGRLDYSEDQIDLYRDPGDETMLRAIQSDILALRDPVAFNSSDALSREATEDDDSISIHACHGPMREAEVVRDRLIDLFERDSSLQARDVVIMTPDVDGYAPFVEAAFSAAGSQSLPIRVADRAMRSSYELFDAFSRLLELLQGRLRASEVLDLLAAPCVRARFGLEEADEPRLRAWIDASGIRWGADAEHRAAEGQPAVDQNTWRFGLDRLLLGFAMEDQGDRLFGSIRPQEAVLGHEAESLGRLADFAEALGQFHERARGSRSPEDWSFFLEQALDRMIFSDSETVYQHRQIRDAIGAWSQAAMEAGYDSLLPLSRVVESLSDWLDEKRAGGGFLAGAITLCELVPMRTIPFKTVVLMGMSDSAFPRVGRRVSFDLLGKQRQLGDRSRRDDDRYLFLEALLSARDHLLMTYTGSDARDNQDRPPSVVIDELLDYLERCFEMPLTSSCSLRDQILVRHPLQSFSPRYFDSSSSGLFSYSESDCEGAKMLSEERSTPTPFVSSVFSGPDEESVEITLQEIVQFFRNPARQFARNTLGLWLPEENDLVAEDREPLEIDGLNRWQVGSTVLGALEDHGSLDATRASVRGLGILPLGLAGDSAYGQIENDSVVLFERAQALCHGDRRPALEVDLDLEGVRLTGRIENVWPLGRVDLRFSKLGSVSELENWIHHLVLCACAPEDWPKFSHQLGQPEKKGSVLSHVRFSPVSEARDRLAEMIALQRLGQRLPIPFFPKTSRKYAETLKRNGDPEKALLDAYKIWRSQDNSRGECEDVYWQRVFLDEDPLSSSFALSGGAEAVDFVSLSERIFVPFLEHREVGQ